MYAMVLPIVQKKMVNNNYNPIHSYNIKNLYNHLLRFFFTDEENCPKKVACSANDRCSQLCILTHDNQRACACDPGFILSKDNRTCEDIDECKFERVCSLHIHDKKIQRKEKMLRIVLIISLLLCF